MAGSPDTARTAWPTGRALLVALVILVMSGLTSLGGNFLIHLYFPDRPYPEDLLFRLLPTIFAAQYLTEVAVVGSLLTVLAYTLTHARSRLADVVAVFGIFYLLRSLLMVMTPLANSYDGPGHYGLMPLDQLGMFPSGHVGASLLCVLLIDRDRALGLWRTALGFLVIQTGALLLSHGHFSIDLAGGLLLAYFVYREWHGGPALRPVRRWMGVEHR